MAEKESGDDGPSLEMPSIGFGRRKRKKQADEPAPQSTTESAKESATESTADPAPEPATEPVPEPTVEQPAVPVSAPEPVRQEPAPVAAAPVEPAPAPLFADEAPTAPVARTAVSVDDYGYSPEDDAEEDDDDGSVSAAPRRRRMPVVGGVVASIVTGAVVGLVMVGLTWSSLRLCEAVQGTSSCGNPGFLLLVAIFVAMVVLGSALLRLLGVTDPGSTSFLGMGLVAVVALLFLVDLLFLWWMALVIPAAAAASYALAHWVTSTFVEPDDANSMHR